MCEKVIIAMFFSYYFVHFYLSHVIAITQINVKPKKWLFNLYLTHAVFQEKEPLFLEQLFGLLGTTGWRMNTSWNFILLPVYRVVAI